MERAYLSRSLNFMVLGYCVVILPSIDTGCRFLYPETLGERHLTYL